MSFPTTFRTDYVAGYVAMLNGVKTAHPDLLKAVFAARPEGYADLPAAFVDSRPETVTQDASTRTRTASPSIVVVRRLTNNAEAMAAFDTLVDLLVEAVTATPQPATGSMHKGDFTIADEEHDYGDFILAAVRITITNLTQQDHRV